MFIGYGCVCVLFWFCLLEPKQNSNYSVFIFFLFVLHIVCKNQKLYFSESLRWLVSFAPSCFILVPFFLDGLAAEAAAASTTTTQNNVYFNTAFNRNPLFEILAGLVVFLILLHFRTEFVFIVADWREVFCLVHRIEPKRQGFTLPLAKISLSFCSAECQLPLVVFEFEPVSPFAMSLVYYDFFPFVWLWVSFVLVRLCFVDK